MYSMDILGCSVVDEEGRYLGMLDSIEVNAVGVVLVVDIEPLSDDDDGTKEPVPAPVKLVPKETP